MDSTQNVQQLFQAARDEGNLSQQSLQVLNVVDLGNQIQAALGANVDDVKANEVTLVNILIDDSSSIRFAGNAQEVRDGHNLVLDDVIANTKQVASVLVHTRYLNQGVLFAYRPVADAIRMDSHNYDPSGGTPLYDAAVALLGTVIAKTQEFLNDGVVARSITLIITDGHDEGSMHSTPADVAALVRDMQHSERHIVSAMGVDDGGTTNFRQIFRLMGIQDEWIYLTKPEPGEKVEDHRRRIRRGFQMFSRSAVRASQGAASFSKTAMGGFGK